MPFGCFAVCHTLCSFTCFRSDSFCALYPPFRRLKSTRCQYCCARLAGQLSAFQGSLAQTLTYNFVMPRSPFHCVSIMCCAHFTGHPSHWHSQDRLAFRSAIKFNYLTLLNSNPCKLCKQQLVFF